MMRRSFRYLLCFFFAAFSAAAIASPAAADNPPCPSGYTDSIAINIQGGHYRAKSCYRRSSDGFAFQDTYVDGWSADFHWPQSADMSKNNLASDKNGAMNGWIYEDESYPSGVNGQMVICSYDYSLSVDHGCTSGWFTT